MVIFYSSRFVGNGDIRLDRDHWWPLYSGSVDPLEPETLPHPKIGAFANLDDPRFTDFQLRVDDSNRRHAQTFG